MTFQPLIAENRFKKDMTAYTCGINKKISRSVYIYESAAKIKRNAKAEKKNE